MTEGVIPYKNKNRGTQVVKLYVPFLFFFCTLCGTNHTECRASSHGSKQKTMAHLKKENGIEELAFAQQ